MAKPGVADAAEVEVALSAPPIVAARAASAAALGIVAAPAAPPSEIGQLVSCWTVLPDLRAHANDTQQARGQSEAAHNLVEL
eukprot:647549-Rhodomonas_salina.3